MRTKVEFDIGVFEFSHARAPRGSGCWAFSTSRNPAAGSPSLMFSPTMSYADAKRWARKQVQGRGHHVTLFVQP